MNERRAIRRILVAVDASTHSLAALEAAADLAVSLRAELAGIFVEDINLLRLADYAFARQICQYAHMPRPLGCEGIEAEFRAQAGVARRAIARLASSRQVPWTFSVSRGSVAQEVLAAAGEADLITLGRVGWSLPRRQSLGSTARAVLLQTPGLALILEEGVRLGQPLLCVYDGTPAAGDALMLAAEISRLRPQGRLTVLLAADEPESAHDLRAEAVAFLGDQTPVRFQSIRPSDPEGVARCLESENCGLLVLPAESPLVREGAQLGAQPRARQGALFGLLSRFRCPVLVVR